MTHTSLDRWIDPANGAVPKRGKSVDRQQTVALVGDLCRSASQRSQTPSHSPTDLPVAVIDAEHVVVLREALIEACGFLEEFGAVGPAKRREMALCIVRQAQDGMHDPHRLAVKAIARAG